MQPATAPWCWLCAASEPYLNAPAADLAIDLLSSSQVGLLMQRKDWSTSPLGDPSTWPPPLRAVVGLMLGSKFAMFTAWGPELGLLYNDAYAEILGAKHPAALGAAFRDVWSEIWDEILPLVHAATSGEAVYREDLPLLVNRRGREEQAWFTFSYSPVRDESGAVAGMFCAVSETTANVRSEQLKSFRLQLDEALLQAVEPREVVDAALGALGRFLGAQRVGYSRVDADARTVLLESCYADGVQPLLGVYPIDEFAPERWMRGLKGETEVCNDVASDPALTRPIWDALQTRAFVSVPLIREGRLRASLYVNYKAPHRWTAEEVALVEQVAARTWEALERARAEASLRESEARFRNMADHAPVMMWITDESGRCVYLNRLWYEFTGQAEEEALGYGWLDATHPDDQAHAADVFRAANDARTSFRIEYRLRRKDGAYRWALDAAAPRFGAEGEFLGYVGSVLDIHENKLAVEHQALLINELNHRVKNTLATVQSMAAQSVRADGDPRAAHEAFMARLMALSAAHNVLTEERWSGADIVEVVRGAGETFSESDERFRTSGPNLRLPPKAALALAMALHELGTNASKYGAFSTPGGWVSLDWSTPAPQRLQVVWREHDGPVAAPPLRKGFGSRLLERGLAAELGGSVTLAFDPAGLVCTIDADLTHPT
jgi:PAS domain S-box-containing protein